jgi:hypothetical protein
MRKVRFSGRNACAERRREIARRKLQNERRYLPDQPQLGSTSARREIGIASPAALLLATWVTKDPDNPYCR